MNAQDLKMQPRPDLGSESIYFCFNFAQFHFQEGDLLLQGEDLFVGLWLVF